GRLDPLAVGTQGHILSRSQGRRIILRLTGHGLARHIDPLGARGCRTAAGSRAVRAGAAGTAATRTGPGASAGPRAALGTRAGTRARAGTRTGPRARAGTRTGPRARASPAATCSRAGARPWSRARPCPGAGVLLTPLAFRL